MKRETISIPAPLAMPEQEVWVLNYRMRPEAWEKATVDAIAYHPAHDRTSRDGKSIFRAPGRWTYEVWITRAFREDAYGRRLGGGYRITVGDEAIHSGEEAPRG